ncbi:hypothetical protein FoTM2_017016, partial [Fusarium oxysporum f. sp. vasinfectum]
MDATGDVILVQGGGSVAATRQTSRTMKRTANLQERLQEKSQAVGERADAVVAPLHGGGGDVGRRVGQQRVADADYAPSHASRDVDSANGRAKKKMLERLWDALMGNQRMTTQMMGEQLEMVRKLQQEVQAVKTQAAEESRKVDELRRLHEQSTRQLRVMREQTSEQIRTTREQTTEQLKIIREQTARNFEQMRLQVMKEVGIVQGQAAEEIRQAKEELKQAREEMQQAKEEISQMKEQLNTIAGSISSGAQT